MTLDTTIGLFDVLQHAKYPDNTVFNLITTHHRRDDLHHFDCNLVKGKISYSGVDQPLSYARIQLPNLCCFAIGTKDGFKVFNSNTGRLCYERAIGAFAIVEMLFSSSLLAIVGAGEEPSLSPRRLCLFNTTIGTALRELNFLTSILSVRMNRKSSLL
ncbi:autophagy-related protein 18b-like [Rosa rugosa]|uniref:autophagy-related protein 18b-like n=1 Tax=Rosa rugosa TaxID=74645 RepID=UPI002B411934|nr:autophagy-related protein 18b-like [Rosa rugosa]